MAVFALTQLHVATNELRLSCFANQVEIMAESDELDVTTFCGGGYRQKITGLSSFNVNVDGFQDYVAPAPGISFPGNTALVDGMLNTWTVAPEGDTVGNTAYFGQSRNVSLTDLSGQVGDVAAFSLGMAGTNRLVRGKMLHPVQARTATGNGDITTFTAPTATQSLHAGFHVHSVTGSGSIVFTVQTDDAVGFASPTTRITSKTFTAVGHEFKSLAGALAGETHIRLGWTITGFTSVTFSAAAGVGVA
jgi:hypothetical protein